MRDSVSDSIAATGMLIVKRRSSVLNCSICVDILFLSIGTRLRSLCVFSEYLWPLLTAGNRRPTPTLHPQGSAAEAIMVVVRMEDSNPHLAALEPKSVRLPIPPHSPNPFDYSGLGHRARSPCRHGCRSALRKLSSCIGIAAVVDSTLRDRYLPLRPIRRRRGGRRRATPEQRLAVLAKLDREVRALFAGAEPSASSQPVVRLPPTERPTPRSMLAHLSVCYRRSHRTSS